MFALPMLFPCVTLHTMSSGKSLQLLCILPFGMLYLSAISMMFVKNLLAVCMVEVILDKTPNYSTHIAKVKAKTEARNNVLKKLSKSR